jgi:hypothetical protein
VLKCGWAFQADYGNWIVSRDSKNRPVRAGP